MIDKFINYCLQACARVGILGLNNFEINLKFFQINPLYHMLFFRLFCSLNLFIFYTHLFDTHISSPQQHALLLFYLLANYYTSTTATAYIGFAIIFFFSKYLRLAYFIDVLYDKYCIYRLSISVLILSILFSILSIQTKQITILI